MDKVLFTIVVCTYNGARFLPKTLDAIENLKMLHEKVAEVIIVDNNSTDTTATIIDGYVKEDSIFKYQFEKRQGLSYAREHAAFVNTDWVIYVDDDNLLDENWLIELEKVILNNEKLGVINGAVIAIPEEELTKTESSILSAMYRNLACTHMNIPKEDDSPNMIPMGAGMCVRVKCLRKIYDEGWLKLLGRNGKKLSSGEDTELSTRVLQQGFEYVCDYSMKLYHIIPKGRLTEEYTIKLIEGLVEGRVDFLKKQKHASLKCLMRKIKYRFVLMRLKRNLENTHNSEDMYWKNRVELIQAQSFIKYL